MIEVSAKDTMPNAMLTVELEDGHRFQHSFGKLVKTIVRILAIVLLSRHPYDLTRGYRHRFKIIEKT